jgi:hypothetical protein
VDLSTVTTGADFVGGLGEPLAEIIHVDFQSNANAIEDADLRVYVARRRRVFLLAPGDPI